MAFKWCFALTLLLYLKQGSSLPGQRYLRLLDMQIRYNVMVRSKVSLTANADKSSVSGDFVGRVVRYFHWKTEYALLHGILTEKLLASDLRYMANLVQ